VYVAMIALPRNELSLNSTVILLLRDGDGWPL